MRSRTSSSLYISRFSQVPQSPSAPQLGHAGAPGSKPLALLMLTVVALVVAVVVSVFAIVSESSDDSGEKTGSPLAGPPPEDVVRVYLRAVEAKDLATVKKVSCEADTEGRTSADLHFGGETSPTVAGKHFEVRGRTVVPLAANGKAPAELGGAEQRGDDGVAPLIRDGSSWKVCFKGFYDDISGKESRGQRRPTGPEGVSWI